MTEGYGFGHIRHMGDVDQPSFPHDMDVPGTPAPTDEDRARAHNPYIALARTVTRLFTHILHATNQE